MTRGRCVLVAVLGLLIIAPGAAAVASGIDITAVEGQSFTGNVVGGLICPLASATITWGDGTTSAGASDGSSGIQGTHSYAEEGTYSGSVSYTYTSPRPCLGSTQSASFEATIGDAPLTATGVDVSGTAGQPLTGSVARFSDANPGATTGDFSVEINWGDGTTSSGTVADTTSFGFDVTGTHTYSAPGQYTVTTTVTDAGGSSTTTSSTAHIGSVPPPPPPPPPRVVPATIIVSGPVGVTSDLQPRFVFTSTIAGSTFQCALDQGHLGTRWFACTSPYITTRLAAGKHSFEVRASSPEGVTDPTGARRSFEVQPAASIEQHSCIRAVWEGASLAGSLVGGKGFMQCIFFFSCPEWYDCVASASITFSFAMPVASVEPHDVFGSLDLWSVTNRDIGPCLREGDQYPQSGETRYCSRSGQITIHGQGPVGPTGPSTPYVDCFAGTFVAISGFASQILGCDALIRRTWAPGVAHAHPLINLVRKSGNVFASSRAALDSGFVASCPAGAGTCAANVAAAVAGAARANAASTRLASNPQPPAPVGSKAPLVGKRSLKIRPGKRAHVTFLLTRRGAALLHKHHRLRITLTITTPPARLRGRDTVITRTLTIVDGH